MMGRPAFLGRDGEWYVVLQVVLVVAAFLIPPAGSWLSSGTGWHLLAYTLGAFSVLMIGLGLRALGSSFAAVPRLREDGRLVQEGIYRVVRHPIYGGLILALLGWAVWQNSLRHLALAGALLVVLEAKVRREERYLAERFPQYPDYRRRTRKFFHWIY